MNRRAFLLSSALALPYGVSAQGKVPRAPGVRLKLGLNAYSFDRPLRAGEMTLEDLVVFAAQNNFDALDATGYYFPGYPKVPTDDTIRSLKKKAYVNGVVLSSTGVRNDFSLPDSTARKVQVQLVKDWIEVAAKLGAPVIRVFSGLKIPEGQTFDSVLKWMVPDFQECAAHGKQFGVILGLQNHNDFLKTADQTIRLIQAVNSDWFGNILDIGSLRSADPYAEIEKLVPYAVSWQLKELVGIDGKEVPTDLRKVKAAIDKVGYRGFLPIETLGAGDPREKVPRFIAQIRAVFQLS
ncbi:MAG: Xylose isomerase domain protein barrel [Candidatus Solibacter sp.]|nr:Xylose isomerase domain protein barrel [Candidatus Solibacter sp.]